jgi:hypothetical protein
MFNRRTRGGYRERRGLIVQCNKIDLDSPGVE